MSIDPKQDVKMDTNELKNKLQIKKGQKKWTKVG